MPTTTTVRVLMKNKSQTRHKKSSLIPARTELGFQKQVFASNIPAVTPDMNIKSIIIIDRHIFHSNFRYVSSSQQSPSLIMHYNDRHISSSMITSHLLIPTITVIIRSDLFIPAISPPTCILPDRPLLRKPRRRACSRP